MLRLPCSTRSAPKEAAERGNSAWYNKHAPCWQVFMNPERSQVNCDNFEVELLIYCSLPFSNNCGICSVRVDPERCQQIYAQWNMTNCTGIREVNKLWSSCGLNVAQLHATNGLWQQSSSITSGSIAASSSADISTNSLQDVLEHRGYFFKVKSERWRFMGINTLPPTASDQIEARAGPSVRSFAPARSPGIDSHSAGWFDVKLKLTGLDVLIAWILSPCLLDA